jgi:hypothetical protein
MKILVFTDETGNKEITAFINAGLTKQEMVFAWTDTLPKAARLETYRPVKIVGTSRFQDSPLQNTISLQQYLPFDGLIIDFSRQTATDVERRLEQEIICIEQLISVQKQNHAGVNFVFIYTTLVETESLSCNVVKQLSDNIHVENWTGLIVNNLPENAVTDGDKIRVIENLLSQLALKYKFTINLEGRLSNTAENGKRLYSVGTIFKVSVD